MTGKLINILMGIGIWAFIIANYELARVFDNQLFIAYLLVLPSGFLMLKIARKLRNYP